LKKIKDCPTPTKFPKYLQKAFKTSPHKITSSEKIFLWNWKQFFSTGIRSLKNFSQHRAFYFKLDSLQQPVMFYKKTLSDLTWCGYEGSLVSGNFFFLI
jgi:hypothetical protein